MSTNNFEILAEVPQATSSSAPVSPLLAEVQADRAGQNPDVQTATNHSPASFDQVLDDSRAHRLTPAVKDVLAGFDCLNTDMRQGLSQSEMATLRDLEQAILLSDPAAIDKTVKTFATDPTQAEAILNVFNRDMKDVGLPYSYGYANLDMLQLEGTGNSLTFSIKAPPQLARWGSVQSVMDNLDEQIVRHIWDYDPKQTPGSIRRESMDKKADLAIAASHTHKLPNGEVVTDRPDGSVITTATDMKTGTVYSKGTGPAPVNNYQSWQWNDANQVDFADGSGQVIKRLPNDQGDGLSLHQWGPKPEDNFDQVQWRDGTLRQTNSDGSGQVVKTRDGKDTLIHSWGPEKKDNSDYIQWDDGTIRQTNGDGTGYVQGKLPGDPSPGTMVQCWGPEQKDNFVQVKWNDGTTRETKADGTARVVRTKDNGDTMIHSWGPNAKDNYDATVSGKKWIRQYSDGTGDELVDLNGSPAIHHWGQYSQDNYTESYDALYGDKSPLNFLPPLPTGR